MTANSTPTRPPRKPATCRHTRTVHLLDAGGYLFAFWCRDCGALRVTARVEDVPGEPSAYTCSGGRWRKPRCRP